MKGMAICDLLIRLMPAVWLATRPSVVSLVGSLKISRARAGLASAGDARPMQSRLDTT